MRGFERRLDLQRAPAVAAKDVGPLRRRELEGRAGALELRAAFLAQHFHEARRHDVEDPVSKRRLLRKVGRQNADVVGAEVDE